MSGKFSSTYPHRKANLIEYTPEHQNFTVAEGPASGLLATIAKELLGQDFVDEPSIVSRVYIEGGRSSGQDSRRFRRARDLSRGTMLELSRPPTMACDPSYGNRDPSLHLDSGPRTFKGIISLHVRGHDER